MNWNIRVASTIPVPPGYKLWLFSPPDSPDTNDGMPFLLRSPIIAFAFIETTDKSNGQFLFHDVVPITDEICDVVDDVLHDKTTRQQWAFERPDGSVETSRSSYKSVQEFLEKERQKNSLRHREMADA